MEIRLFAFRLDYHHPRNFNKIETQTCRARPFVRSSYFHYSNTTFQNSNQYSFPMQTIRSKIFIKIAILAIQLQNCYWESQALCCFILQSCVNLRFYMLGCKLGLTPRNLSCSESKFDDTRLSTFLLEKLNWDSQQGRDLATSGCNKQKFQFGQSYSYTMRKVWCHQIWIQNNSGFMVLS